MIFLIYLYHNIAEIVSELCNTKLSATHYILFIFIIFSCTCLLYKYFKLKKDIFVWKKRLSIQAIILLLASHFADRQDFLYIFFFKE